jgi:hypothetical protein
VAGLARILFGPVCIGVDCPEPVLSSTIVVWRGVVAAGRGTAAVS